MTIYTAVKISRYSEVFVLYCGTDKEIAEEFLYFDSCDETAPDKDKAFRWRLIIETFPEW